MKTEFVWKKYDMYPVKTNSTSFEAKNKGFMAIFVCRNFYVYLVGLWMDIMDRI